jgi:amiloride-sensitive sodium channel
MDITHVPYNVSCGKNYFAIHGHNELPLGADLNEMDFNTAYDVLITPEVIKSHKRIKSLSVKRRKCYFEGERKLKYFKVYTQRNCETECLSHVGEESVVHNFDASLMVTSFQVFNECDCVPFFYVRGNATPVCDFKIFAKCVEAFEEMKSFETYDRLFKSHGVCMCHQLCNSISYSFKVLKIFNKSIE